MSSSAPRFVLHTVADHLNYTAAIDKENAARLQDILHRRSKHHKHLQKVTDNNNVNNCWELEHSATEKKSPFDDDNCNSKRNNPANARKNAEGQIECNHDKANGYTHHNINNNKIINQHEKQSKSICYLPADIKKRTKTRQTSCTTRTNTTTESRRAHINKLALPKVNCQCQKLLPRVPVQYRKDVVFDATYTPGVDYDRIVMPRTRVMSALSATYTYEHHYPSSSPSSSVYPHAPLHGKNKTQNDKAVHNHKKEFTSHCSQNWNKLNRNDANDVLLASTVKEIKMCDAEHQHEQQLKHAETYENSENNDLHSANTKHTRTPSVFSHSSSFGPITKLGVPHLTSHATAQSVQAHLAHIHAQKSRTESTLTAAKLSRHNEMCKHNSSYLSPHSQKPTPFHEMSTYELSRWLQQVQLHPTY